MITREHQPARFHTSHENQQTPASGLLPHQAEGLTEFSRWLRSRQRPTPPDPVTPKNRIPAGCQTGYPVVANFATTAAATFSIFHFGTNCRRRELDEENKFSILENMGIGKHLRRIFTKGELEEKVVCANFAHTTPRRAQVRFPHTHAYKIYAKKQPVFRRRHRPLNVRATYSWHRSQACRTRCAHQRACQARNPLKK